MKANTLTISLRVSYQRKELNYETMCYTWVPSGKDGRSSGWVGGVCLTETSLRRQCSKGFDRSCSNFSYDLHFMLSASLHSSPGNCVEVNRQSTTRSHVLVREVLWSGSSLTLTRRSGLASHYLGDCTVAFKPHWVVLEDERFSSIVGCVAVVLT